MYPEELPQAAHHRLLQADEEAEGEDLPAVGVAAEHQAHSVRRGAVHHLRLVGEEDARGSLRRSGERQIGPGLVLFPAVAWMYWKGDPTWATILLVWSVLVTILDNFLRPVLIRRGADLPLLLIFAGVIGGLLSFGLLGIFVGPLVLAVTYTLLEAWVKDEHHRSDSSGL